MGKKTKSITKKVHDFKKEVPPKHLPRDEFELEELTYTLSEAMEEGTYKVFGSGAKIVFKSTIPYFIS